MTKHVLNRLNAKKIDRLPPGRHSDGGGLWLNVRSNGSRSWELRFTLHGKVETMGLGSAAEVTLAAAREKASGSREQVRIGKDPRLVRDQQLLDAMKGTTFRSYADRYFEKKKAGWSAAHQYNTERFFRIHIYPVKIINGTVFGDLPIEMADTKAVLKVLEPIWTTKTPTATAVRLLIEAVIDFASALDDLSIDNPARWRGRLKTILAAPSTVHQSQHLPSLHYLKGPEYVETVGKRNTTSAAVLEFLIHAPVRIKVAVSAEWAEFTPRRLPVAAWSFPTGNGRSHRPR